jgi:hypothetical protein
LSVGVKREVLKLLREDEEFRYAVAGMIGLDEILKRLDAHEKELVGLREETARLWKEIVKLREETARLWKEMVRLREDTLRGFERMDKRFEHVDKRFEYMDKRLEYMDRHLGALGARWGLMAEEAFREGLKGFLAKELKLGVKRWVRRDEDGMVYGYPSMVEIDLSVSDEKTTLIEISSHVRSSDVLLFAKKTQFYEKATGRKPDRLLIVTPYAEKEAFEAAERYGIEIYTKV